MRTNQGFRRPHNPALDGPIPLYPGDSSTRVKQIAKVLRVHDSGVDAGQYYSDASKDHVMRNTQTGAYMSRTDRCGRHTPHLAESLSAALKHGHTFVDVALGGAAPLDTSTHAHSAAEELRAAAARMPRMAEGHALDLPPWHARNLAAQQLSAASLQPVASALPDPAESEDGFAATAAEAPDAAAADVRERADEPVAEGTGSLQQGDGLQDDAAGGAQACSDTTAQAAQANATDSANIHSDPGASPEEEASAADAADNCCTDEAQPRGWRRTHLYIPQKPPPPEVARSAALHHDPGKWDWVAAGRALHNTFTMQDGGGYRRNRVQVQPSVDKLDAFRVPPKCTRQHCMAAAEAREHSGQLSPSHGQGLAHQPRAVSAPYSVKAEACSHNLQRESTGKRHTEQVQARKLKALDPTAEARHAAAKRAAGQVQAVQERQRRWQLQSQLLPLMKRDAMLRSVVAPTSSTM